jgi:hypothetical protein
VIPPSRDGANWRDFSSGIAVDPLRLRGTNRAGGAAMRHSFLFFVLSALMAAACGVGTSQSSRPDPTPLPTHPATPITPEPDDAGVDAEVCSSGIDIQCRDCFGNPVPPECVGGSLQCPLYGCPVELPDAGCTSYPPTCPVGCDSVCDSNQWACTCEGPPPDASVDVFVPPPPFDAQTDPLVACGSLECYSATTYCQVTTGGPADAATGFECIPLPATCSAGAASCACIQAVQGIGCSCVQSGDLVTITCEIQ